MNLAKVSANGQITVPIEIRRILGIKAGDKVLFFKTAEGDVVMTNASVKAIRQAQQGFIGVAESIGVHNEEEVQNLVNEVRYGRN